MSTSIFEDIIELNELSQDAIKRIKSETTPWRRRNAERDERAAEAYAADRSNHNHKMVDRLAKRNGTKKGELNTNDHGQQEDILKRPHYSEKRFHLPENKDMEELRKKAQKEKASKHESALMDIEFK